MDLRRSLLFLRKKLTVIGIIGHTQGVKRATRPPRKQVKKIYQSEVEEKSSASLSSSNFTGAQRSEWLVDADITVESVGMIVAAESVGSVAGTSLADSCSAVRAFSALLLLSALASVCEAAGFALTGSLAVPERLNEVRAGGMQFSSLQAEYTSSTSILNAGFVAVNFWIIVTP